MAHRKPAPVGIRDGDVQTSRRTAEFRKTEGTARTFLHIHALRGLASGFGADILNLSLISVQQLDQMQPAVGGRECQPDAVAGRCILTAGMHGQPGWARLSGAIVRYPDITLSGDRHVSVIRGREYDAVPSGPDALQGNVYNGSAIPERIHGRKYRRSHCPAVRRSLPGIFIEGEVPDERCFRHQEGIRSGP